METVLRKTFKEGCYRLKPVLGENQEIDIYILQEKKVILSIFSVWVNVIFNNEVIKGTEKEVTPIINHLTNYIYF